jgi:2'-5' RNA ligase
MPRLFLAIPLPAEIKNILAQEVGQLKNLLSDWGVKWVTPENLHITLIFFGGVKEEQVYDLKDEIAGTVRDFSSFEISTGGLTVEGRPIWLEIDRGQKELTRLFRKLAKVLTIKGSAEESRPFHPHLTLGRVKKRGKIPLPRVKRVFSWRAERLELFESQLRRTGPTYTPLAGFELARKRLP